MVANCKIVRSYFIHLDYFDKTHNFISFYDSISLDCKLQDMKLIHITAFTQKLSVDSSLYSLCWIMHKYVYICLYAYIQNLTKKNRKRRRKVLAESFVVWIISWFFFPGKTIYKSEQQSSGEKRWKKKFIRCALTKCIDFYGLPFVQL